MSRFHIGKHQVLGAHMREYEDGLINESIPPTLSVKQYSPIRNERPSKGDPSFIIAGGIGFIKEVYEALIEDLDVQLAKRNIQVRSYWTIDMYCIGASATANGGNLGTSPSWYDHARDLSCVVNNFYREMPSPVFGIGHSMGGAQIAHLSLIHPRLLRSIILIEPAIYAGLERKTAFAQAKGMARRPDQIPSAEKARTGIEKSPFYGSWDPRAREALLKYAYADLDTNRPVDLTSPDIKGPIKSSTPKVSEVALIFRPNFHNVGANGLDVLSMEDRLDRPDVDPAAKHIFPFYRTENVGIAQRLPHLRPSVLFVCGGASVTSAPENRRLWLDTTGTGVGGSGGHRLGRVREVVIPGGGHTIPMDETHLPAVVENMAIWIDEDVAFWREHQRGKDKEVQPAIGTMMESFREWKPEGKPIEEIVKAKL